MHWNLQIWWYRNIKIFGFSLNPLPPTLPTRVLGDISFFLATERRPSLIKLYFVAVCLCLLRVVRFVDIPSYYPPTEFSLPHCFYLVETSKTKSLRKKSESNSGCSWLLSLAPNRTYLHHSQQQSPPHEAITHNNNNRSRVFGFVRGFFESGTCHGME